MPRMSRARSISWRRTSVMLAAMSGRSIFGFRIDPRSPPVQVATWTSTPSATYFAVEAAPLLDSSSGWAWTCMSRRPERGLPAGSADMRLSLGGTIDGVDETLTERYAAPPAWRRPVTIAGVVLVALVALGWLAWGIVVQSTPKVQSELITFHVVDAHSATARVDVSLASGTHDPRCTVQALASDHSVVGELVFTPTDGTNVVTVRTEREATSVVVPGCIADGQDRPR